MICVRLLSFGASARAFYGSPDSRREHRRGRAMLRIMILALIVALGIDHSFMGGGYTKSVQQVAHSVLHHFRMR